MKKPVFTGAAVAIITPFKSTGEVDYEEFGKIIDHQIAHGTDAIVVCGTTGDRPPDGRLSAESGLQRAVPHSFCRNP